MPPYNHRRPAKNTYTTSGRAAPRRTALCKPQAGAAAYLQQALGPEDAMPRTELNELEALRLEAQRNDKWALLDTFEAHLCNENRAMREQRKVEECAQTRAFLDGQMKELQKRSDAEAAQRLRDREEVQAATEKHARDEAAKAAAMRAKHAQLKQASEKQVAEFRHASNPKLAPNIHNKPANTHVCKYRHTRVRLQVQVHTCAHPYSSNAEGLLRHSPNRCCTCRARQAKQVRRRLEDEQAEIAEIQSLDDAAATAAAARKAELAAEVERVKRQNEARIAAKRAAKVAAAAEDKALVDETMRTLERQDAACKRRLADFHVRS
jgi:hypothetical protein